MNVYEYIAHETERQSGTPAEAAGMGHAWLFWVTLDGPVTEDLILDSVESINGLSWYRQVPAYFASGGHAINAHNVPAAMEALIAAVNEPWDNALGINPGAAVVATKADVFTKEFLLIHPFADGNGRVGSLLWNYLNGSIEDPEPMPYFFGEGVGG